MCQLFGNKQIVIAIAPKMRPNWVTNPMNIDIIVNLLNKFVKAYQIDNLERKYPSSRWPSSLWSL